MEKAAGQGAMAEAEAPVQSPDRVGSVTVSEVVQNVGAQAFVNQDGVWIDTRFDPDTMKTTKVAFLSEDYFALVAARPELAAAFALGEQVIAFADGTAYEVVAADESGDKIDVPDAYPTPEKADVKPVDDDDVRPDMVDDGGFPNCAFAPVAFMAVVMVVYLKRRK